MILAIDVGNTNIVLGCIDGDECLFVERLSTVRTKTELEYAIDIKNVLDIYHIHRSDIEGGIVSSVVPQITNIVKLAVEKILKKEVLVVGAGIKTGLNIRMDNPAQLGSDLVVNAVAGIAEYPVPLLILDLGTANTVSVIDKNKNYIGGMIYPGIGVSLDSLTARASQLGGIGIEAPEHIIGKNTVECMKSGIIYSSAAAIDGIIDRLQDELEGEATVIATGGLAKKIVPHCKREIILDDDLLLKGRQQSYGGSQQGYSQQNYGFDGFDGFDPFGFGFGFNGYSQQSGASYSGSDSPEMQAARNFVVNGRYAEARRVLDGMTARNARWYYLSSLANQGLGNSIDALQDARRAVQLDPNNTEYRMHLQRLQNPGRTYRTQTTYAQPGGIMRWCWSMILLNLLCNCCCGGWGFGWGFGPRYGFRG